MKKYKCSFVLLILIICMSTGTSQVNFNANAGGGLLKMTEGNDYYFPGYRINAGLTIDGSIPIAEDLSWETGLETAFGQVKFYKMARGDHSGVDGDVPLDKSVKYTHSFWMLDIPARVRYNAFDFMGVMAGVNLSWLLDRRVYHPDLYQSFEDFFDKKMIATGEAGLFFPVTDRLRVDLKAYKALNGRFYLSESVNANGQKVYGGAYSDYGFLVNLAYRLNK